MEIFKSLIVLLNVVSTDFFTIFGSALVYGFLAFGACKVLEWTTELYSPITELSVILAGFFVTGFAYLMGVRGVDDFVYNNVSLDMMQFGPFRELIECRVMFFINFVFVVIGAVGHKRFLQNW